VIAFNAPQLPLDALAEETKREIEGSQLQKSFRSGGGDGLNLVKLFLSWYSELASPRPRAFLGVSSFLGWKPISFAFESFGFFPRIIGEERIELRKILCAHAERIAGNSFVVTDKSLEKRDGTWTKKIFVLEPVSAVGA
jgi:hypothetical protein